MLCVLLLSVAAMARAGPSFYNMAALTLDGKVGADMTAINFWVDSFFIIHNNVCSTFSKIGPCPCSLIYVSTQVTFVLSNKNACFYHLIQALV